MKRSLLYTGMVAMFAISSCHSKTDDSVKTTFVLSDTMMASIRIDTAKVASVPGELRFYGKVVPNGGKTVNVFTPANGYVEQVKVQLGEHVDKGQVLAIINSNNTDPGIAGKKGDGSTHLVTAPMPGYITEKNVHDSMNIRSNNSKQIFTISELDEVWVMASVPGAGTARAKEGDTVMVSATSHPGSVFQGQIDKVYNATQVRVRLQHPGISLKPKTIAALTLNYVSSGEKISIPSASVIFDKHKYYVMVFRDKYNIDTREVMVAKSLNGITYIEAGLKPGEKVVSKNQQLIYDALND